MAQTKDGGLTLSPKEREEWLASQQLVILGAASARGIIDDQTADELGEILDGIEKARAILAERHSALLRESK